MKYATAAVPDGIAVYRQGETGALVILSVHAERTSADREAGRLNAERAAEWARVQSTRYRQNYTDLRRTVRYFEPDAAA